jgi:hypothetical protein
MKYYLLGKSGLRVSELAPRRYPFRDGTQYTISEHFGASSRSWNKLVERKSLES